MRFSISTRLMFLTAICGLAAPAASSAAGNQYATISGASCKPTSSASNSSFVTKSVGARNESTTSGVFVVCPFMLSPVPSNGGVITDMNITLYSIDGVSRTMSCTAVIGSLNRYVPATYSPKTVSVPTQPAGIVMTWNAADFGGTAGAGIPGSAWTTVTCLLPPQTAIGLIYATNNPNLGQ
jgi:hypothetical protein